MVHDMHNYNIALPHMMECGCHCIRCGSTRLESRCVGEIEQDGYYDMHHTCGECGAHFDHLEGDIFEECDKCGITKTGGL